MTQSCLSEVNPNCHWDFYLLAVEKLYKYVEHVSSLYTVLCPLLQVSLIRRASCWGQGAVLYRYGRRKTVLRLRTVHKRAMYCITEACRKYRFNVFDLFYIQQSSTDIWHAVCAAVKSACSLAGVAPEEVAGLGFAATCSLGLFWTLLSFASSCVEAKGQHLNGRVRFVYLGCL